MVDPKSDPALVAHADQAIEPILDAQKAQFEEIQPTEPQPIQTATLAKAQEHGMQTLVPSNP